MIRSCTRSVQEEGDCWEARRDQRKIWGPEVHKREVMRVSQAVGLRVGL